MNRLAIKEGAVLSARHFDPEFAAVFVVALEKAPATTDDSVWVTSGADAHETGLHPHFRAADFRTKNIQAPSLEMRRQKAREWAGKIARRLGPDFDVRFEQFPEHPDRDHIHVEYDPKG